MKWIDVKKQLPPNPEALKGYKSYLIEDKSGVSIAIYRGSGEFHDLINRTDKKNVLFWMPHHDH